VPLDVAAGEVGDQAVDRAQERGLAGAGGADGERELALGDVQVDVAQGGESAPG
jgi:hypothetical protein